MSTGNQTVDPVCGMTVDPKTALSSFKDGETFYFCSQHSLEKFTGSRETGVDTMSNIRQSLLFAFIYNALGVPIAAGIFGPFFGINALLSPMIAAAMSLSSVSVIANALRLRNV